MFSIYLLEDNPEQQAFYARIIKNTIMINDYAMKLVCATNSVEKLENGILDQEQGLFFLDMEIAKQTDAGLKLASKIRQKMPFAQIVFVTTHDELAFLTLERKIAPLDYILKDQSIEDIKSKIIEDVNLARSQYVESLYHQQSLFGYHIGSRYFSVPMSELVMLYTIKERPGSVTMIAENRQAEFPGNLNNLEEKYTNLFRCDKSYLVNLDHMTSFNAQTRQLHFNQGLFCKASFRKARDLTKLMKNHVS
ncbi:response regulator transcription factor [Pediococcus ethanolidurans]|uniref:Response regulator n=1 Tax=Pediococcus ethanolidurans TaxID=319653 RepID=A0A0R2JVY1_9LACO|nr:response regulator transcription factor [Pediococcus ethanolidurans]KRN81328.1 response regulator [Pediococcus ethanolidurans]GEN95974.1 DNA-binding response regulator [Pediococcus ethanolidurans]SER92438.1 two component transcriptional regulator, LytTR family [Pediococcus ethanolidurans]